MPEVKCEECPIREICVYSGHWKDHATQQCPLLKWLEFIGEMKRKL